MKRLLNPCSKLFVTGSVPVQSFILAELAAVDLCFAGSLFLSGRGNTCPESTGDHVTAGVESPP